MEERCLKVEIVHGATVIDDTWNTSQTSIEAALDVLKDGANKRKIALLGYIPQLGQNQYATEQYARIGEKVKEAGVDILVVAGEKAAAIGLSALASGMGASKILFSSCGSEIYRFLLPHLDENTLVLLKITHRQMVKPSFVRLKKNLLQNKS